MLNHGQEFRNQIQLFVEGKSSFDDLYLWIAEYAAELADSDDATMRRLQSQVWSIVGEYGYGNLSEDDIRRSMESIANPGIVPVHANAPYTARHGAIGPRENPETLRSVAILLISHAAIGGRAILVGDFDLNVTVTIATGSIINASTSSFQGISFIEPDQQPSLVHVLTVPDTRTRTNQPLVLMA